MSSIYPSINPSILIDWFDIFDAEKIQYFCGSNPGFKGGPILIKWCWWKSLLVVPHLAKFVRFYSNFTMVYGRCFIDISRIYSYGLSN